MLKISFNGIQFTDTSHTNSNVDSWSISKRYQRKIGLCSKLFHWFIEMCFSVFYLFFSFIQMFHWSIQFYLFSSKWNHSAKALVVQSSTFQENHNQIWKIGSKLKEKKCNWTLRRREIDKPIHIKRRYFRRRKKKQPKKEVCCNFSCIFQFMKIWIIYFFQ